MRDLSLTVKLVLSAVGGFMGSLFGELDGLLYALLVFLMIDYLTGVMAAIVEKRLSSTIGFKGIFKKMMLLFLVSLAHMMDTYILKESGIVRTTVIFFYLSNEGLSILENAVRIGLPIPEKLTILLKSIQDDEEQ